MKALVSIVMPVYNSARYLSEAIESVRQQSYPHWQLIIVDDASEDESRAIARRYARCDARIELVELAVNVGAAAARNRGLERARGRYLAFLDSDDRWAACKLERQIAYMEAEGVCFSCSYAYVLDAQGRIVDELRCPLSIRYNDLLKTNHIVHSSVVYDASILGKQQYPSHFPRHEDIAVWLRILKEGRSCCAVPEFLTMWRRRKDSISSDKIEAMYWEWKLLREIEGLGVVQSVYYFSHWAVRGMVKHMKMALKGDVQAASGLPFRRHVSRDQCRHSARSG